jgi:hypothetical protein
MAGVELELSASTLVFPAVSFLMLAYGQRYVAITGRIRQLVAEGQGDRSALGPDDERTDGLRLKQVEVLRRRVGMIRVMQSLAVLALLFGIVSALIVLLEGHQWAAKTMFACSLGSMVVSLLVTLWEIQLSSVAVDLQIESAERSLIRSIAP